MHLRYRQWRAERQKRGAVGAPKWMYAYDGVFWPLRVPAVYRWLGTSVVFRCLRRRARLHPCHQKQRGLLMGRCQCKHVLTYCLGDGRVSVLKT